ncbi:MAG: TonB-dependent receptor plug domain-containing protein [Gemmatimonadetes bacterium]|nr:carboxypeptidase-like regulatory domain-containing protein [Gemmatimonadota bacterium]MYA43329.1 TonB-dependent receptor plug domain-containing protein [Gemmatimonadota bacterium]MYE94092.1 TonB-dependent receptor plug domain-containing protein [Gemmatimonadota bacterium]MYJ10904.1 TonB-dependent receptor plug domain-containing protein [Gemmatimonadota bacterium]
MNRRWRCRLHPAPAMIAAVAAAIAASVAGASAQETERERVPIAGTVVDAITGAPIQGVTVVLGGMGFRLETDAAGRFRFARVPLGTYRLELSHPAYQPTVGDFTVMRAGEFVTSLQPVNVGDDELVTGIIGVVSDVDGGGPISGAAIHVAGSGDGSLTNARGEFTLAGMPPGTHIVEFSRLGYITRTDSVHVLPDRVTSVRVALSADPLRLDPITVTVERREIVLQGVGFYSREAEGFGEFIDREEIENRVPSEMTDLFARIPGADLRADAWNPLERYVILRGGRAEGCFPRVVLDGVVVSGGGDAPAALDQMLDPQSVAGVEVYVSSTGVPLQYAGTGASCGLIVIWTRR